MKGREIIGQETRCFLTYLYGFLSSGLGETGQLWLGPMSFIRAVSIGVLGSNGMVFSS